MLMESKIRQVCFYAFFLITITFFSFLSFSLAKNAIEIETDWPDRFLWPAVALFVLGALFSLVWLLLADSRQSKYFLALLSLFCALWLFVFLDWHKISFWPIFLLSLAFFYFAGHQAIKEKEACFKIQLSRILSTALILLFTGLALIAASFHYFYQVKFPPEAFEISPNLTNFVIQRLDEFLGNGRLGETISLNMTIDEYLETNLLKSGEMSATQLKDPRIRALINKEIDKARDELNRQYGLHLTGQEKIAQVIASFITVKINQILGPYRKYIPLALAFGLFIALRAIGFIYVNIVLGMVWVLLKLLVIFKLVRIEKVMAEKEVIRI